MLGFFITQQAKSLIEENQKHDTLLSLIESTKQSDLTKSVKIATFITHATEKKFRITYDFAEKVLDTPTLTRDELKAELEAMRKAKNAEGFPIFEYFMLYQFAPQCLPFQIAEDFIRSTSLLPKPVLATVKLATFNAMLLQDPKYVLAPLIRRPIATAIRVPVSTVTEGSTAILSHALAPSYAPTRDQRSQTAQLIQKVFSPFASLITGIATQILTNQYAPTPDQTKEYFETAYAEKGWTTLVPVSIAYIGYYHGMDLLEGMRKSAVLQPVHAFLAEMNGPNFTDNTCEDVFSQPSNTVTFKKDENEKTREKAPAAVKTGTVLKI